MIWHRNRAKSGSKRGEPEGILILPFNPSGQLRGDQYINQFGQNVSENIVTGLKQYNQDQQVAAYSDTVMEHLARQPADPTDPSKGAKVPLAVLNDYHNAKLKTRVGMAMAAQAADAADNARQHQEEQLQIQRQHLQQSAKQFAADQEPFEASDKWLGGTHVVEVRPGEFQIDPTQGGGANGKTAEPTVIDPYIDPVTQRPVPGMGVVRKTGAVVDKSGVADGLVVQQDPATGAYFYRTEKGAPKQIKAADPFKEKLAQMMGGASPTPAPSPAATPAPSAAPTAATAPEGAYGRKGAQWYRKVNGQWQPSGEPVAR